jgi:hypothetical protein
MVARGELKGFLFMDIHLPQDASICCDTRVKSYGQDWGEKYVSSGRRGSCALKISFNTIRKEFTGVIWE